MAWPCERSSGHKEDVLEGVCGVALFPRSLLALVILVGMTFLYLDIQPYLKISRTMAMEWNLGNHKQKSILFFHFKLFLEFVLQ